MQLLGNIPVRRLIRTDSLVVISKENVYVKRCNATQLLATQIS